MNGENYLEYVDPKTGSVGTSTTTGKFPYELLLKAIENYEARKKAQQSQAA